MGMGKGSIFSGELVIGGDNSAETAISPTAKETNHPRNLFYNIFSSYSENVSEKPFGSITQSMCYIVLFFCSCWSYEYIKSCIQYWNYNI